MINHDLYVGDMVRDARLNNKPASMGMVVGAVPATVGGQDQLICVFWSAGPDYMCHLDDCWYSPAQLEKVV
jgi:hypothetical protein